MFVECVRPGIYIRRISPGALIYGRIRSIRTAPGRSLSRRERLQRERLERERLERERLAGQCAKLLQHAGR